MLDVQLSLRRRDFRLRVDTRFERHVTGVFGPSGSGKSTLLHAIAGLVRPDEGRIALDGKVLFDAARGVHVPIHHRRIGVVFQDARLFPHVSVARNLRYGMTGHAADVTISFDAIVSLLELERLLERRPRELSGGERQRVALGRSLLASPRLLLLDEPMASLDRALKSQILPFLKRVRNHVEIPMLYVSHDLEEVLQLTERLVLLEAGSIAGEGTVADLALSTGSTIGDEGVVNVLDAHVTGVTADATRLRVGESGPEFRAPPFGLAEGARVGVALRGGDIALSRRRIDGISIQNQCEARVSRIAEVHGTVIVELDIGVPIVATVTRAARDSVGLQAGGSVWCLIKAGAIRLL